MQDKSLMEDSYLFLKYLLQRWSKSNNFKYLSIQKY